MFHYKNRIVFTGGTGRFANSFKAQESNSNFKFFFPKKTELNILNVNLIKKYLTKVKPKLSTAGGTSDARFIRKISPCVEFGLVGKTAHKADEMVSVSDMKKLKKIYLNILLQYFK